MRIVKCLLFVALVNHAVGQVPNGGFELWNENVPENWGVNNIAPLEFYPITPSSDAHSGSLAARGEVLQNPIFTDQVVSPTLQTQGGVAVTGNPSSITGWYKFEPTQSTTNFVIGLTVLDINGMLTGTGTTQYFDAQNEYTQFNATINYDVGTSDPAASVTISFIIADDESNGALGSWFLVDDIMVNGANGIGDLRSASTAVGNPYPSPFSSTTVLSFSSNTNVPIFIDVVDILGRTVETVSSIRTGPGKNTVEWTPSSSQPNGIYFLRLTEEQGVVVRRVVLQR